MPAPVVAPRPLRRRGAAGVPVVTGGTPVDRWLPTLVTAALAVAASVVATLVVVTGDVWSYSPAPQLLVDAAVGLGFPVIAAVIAVADGRPVLFRQERIGRAGETFRILKFRTMGTAYSGRPALEVFRELGREDLVEEFKREQKVKDDPRVSPLGAFLRRTSLDELPQLWNVLCGELSLVGPRPIVRDELVKFGDFTGTILALQPGITGLWQTSGRNDISYEERVKLNIQYVESWSLRLDVLILMRTLALVLHGGGGAY